MHILINRLNAFQSFLVILSGVILMSCNQNSGNGSNSSSGDPVVDAMNIEISKDSTNHGLLFERANYYYENDNYDEAIADLVKAIDIDSSVFQYHHLLSDAYMDYFKSRDALRTMEIAADLFPRNIPTLLKLSETQHILKLYEESLMTIARLLTVDDQNPEAYFMMGLNFRSVGEPDRAINALQTATELDPELIDAWLILGNLYESKNDPIALKYYEAAINVNPGNPSSWHSKAFYLQNNGQIDEAIKLYQHINRIDKYYLDAYLNSGILYMTLDSFAQAHNQFNIMANLKTQNYMAYYYRGLANKAMGKIEDARKDFQNCINLNPEFSKAKIALTEIEQNS